MSGRRLLAQVHHVLHHVAQLAHVAGPRVLGQQRPRLLGQRARRPAHPLQHRVDQQGDVLRALAQRRQRHAQHREPVEQVLAELPRLHRRLQVHVRGRHHPHVHRAVVVGAHPLHLPPLQHAQQPGLDAPAGSSPTSSRKTVPPSARSKAPARSALGAGEGALHVAEQLGLDERGRDARQIHDDERALVARALLVDALGAALLAGARLALDEHVRVSGAPAAPAA